MLRSLHSGGSGASADTHTFRWGMRDRNLVVKPGGRHRSAVLRKAPNNQRFMVSQSAALSPNWRLTQP